MGTWKKRKGWDKLLEAWMTEFKSTDNVQLLIKTDRYTQSTQAVQTTRNNLRLSEKDIAPILWETRVLNELELPRLFKSVDCLVIPTLGEGFCIPGLQSMAVGVPLIITDFSGCQDYATDKTATLLKPQGYLLYNEMDGIPQMKCKKWANITVKEIAKQMRFVYENYDAALAKAKVALPIVVENYSYSKTADKLTQVIELLK